MPFAATALPSFWKEDGRFCSWRVPFGLSAESAGDLGYLRGDEFSSTNDCNLWAKRKEGLDYRLGYFRICGSHPYPPTWVPSSKSTRGTEKITYPLGTMMLERILFYGLTLSVLVWFQACWHDRERDPFGILRCVELFTE